MKALRIERNNQFRIQHQEWLTETEESALLPPFGLQEHCVCYTLARVKFILVNNRKNTAKPHPPNSMKWQQGIMSLVHETAA